MDFSSIVMDLMSVMVGLGVFLASLYYLKLGRKEHYLGLAFVGGSFVMFYGLLHFLARSLSFPGEVLVGIAFIMVAALTAFISVLRKPSRKSNS